MSPEQDGAVDMRRKVSDEAAAQIRTAWNAGAKADELAVQHGICKSTVYHVVRNEPCRRSRKITPAAEAEIRARWRQGAHAADLAAEYGVGKTTIYDIFERERTRARPPDPRRIKDDVAAHISDAWKAGIRAKDIAVQHGIHEATVYKLVKRERPAATEA